MVRPVQDDRPILDEWPRPGDKLQIAKMNVDENREFPPSSASRHPTLMLFKDGQLAATKVGALSRPN